MRKAISSAAIIVLAGGSGLLGQAPAANDLSFDVASVRPAAPPQPQLGGGRGVFTFGTRGGPGTPDPGQITSSNVTLKSLLTTAYDVKPYQVTGPAWLDTERYDIVAKVPAGTTKEQSNIMLQNLLKERFGMVLHHESKEFQVDELVVAKGGSKLKETTVDPNAPPPALPTGPPAPPKLDKNGVPELNGNGPGLMMMIMMGPTGPNGHLVARAQPVSALANMLGNQMNRPVVDKTGLTGKYDFNLEYTPDLAGLPLPPPPPGGGPVAGPPPGAAPSDNASEPGSNIVAAMQQQLGLRLTPSKAKLDVVVIDKAEKTPTDN